MSKHLAVLAAIGLCTPLLADVTVRYTGDYKLGFPSAVSPAQLPDGVLGAINGPSEIRIKGNKSYQLQGKFITITDHDSNEITYVDSEKMRFGTANIAEFAKIVSKAMPQMPQTPNLADTIKTDVQSRKTGRTETIHGIPAEETEIVLTLSLNVPNLPAGNPAMRMVMQEWRAVQEEDNPALAELAHYRNLPNSSIDAGSMLRQLSGSGFAQSFAPILEEIAKDKRLLLRLHMAATSPIMAVLAAQAATRADPNAPLVTVNRELAELSTDTVDESVFRIPENYRKVEIEEILKDQIGGILSRAQ